MKKKQEKSPILAAILNFFFTGIGYVYAGKRVEFGIGIFIVFLFYEFMTYDLELMPIDVFLGVTLAFLFAYDGYKTAEEVNKK